MRELVCVVMLVLAGCGKKQDEAPAKTAPAADEAARKAQLENENEPLPKAPPQPPKGQATVDITLTGAIEKHVTGAVGMCGATQIQGRLQGASFQVNDDDFQLVVMATTDDELKEPKVIVNQNKPAHASYALVKVGGPGLKLERDKGAEVDVDVSNVVKRNDPKQRIHIKGTITCNTL